VVSAFITPGADLITLLAMAVPLYLLYELSIWLSGIVYRRQQRRAAREAASAARREVTA
jgi:sec-independent protein translocase protein TatC